MTRHRQNIGSHIMKRTMGAGVWQLPIAVFALIVALSVVAQRSEATGSGNSQSLTPAEVLPVGGYTLGGPGLFRGAPGTGTVFRMPGYFGAGVCITISNRGSVGVVMTAVIGSGGPIPEEPFVDSIAPGDVGTRCMGGGAQYSPIEIILSCEDTSASCRAFWRLDSFRN